MAWSQSNIPKLNQESSQSSVSGLKQADLKTLRPWLPAFSVTRTRVEITKTIQHESHIENNRRRHSGRPVIVQHSIPVSTAIKLTAIPHWETLVPCPTLNLAGYHLHSDRKKWRGAIYRKRIGWSCCCDNSVQPYTPSGWESFMIFDKINIPKTNLPLPHLEQCDHEAS